MSSVDDAPSQPARPVPLSKGHRITHWDPEDEYFWENGGSRIARRNMICSVITEHFGFAVWTMWSSLVLFLGPEYGLTPDQKFLLVSIPAAVGGALRIPYSMAVARFGGRDWTIVSACMLLLPTITAAFLLKPGVDFGVLLMLVALAGVGGGNFASSMSNINAFYPDRAKGLALGINAAAGNLGVAVAQLLGLAVLATIGAAHPRVLVGIYLPVVIVCALIAALYMDNLVHQVNDKGAVREACREPHTWVISLLYIGTFGSFIGFSFAFGQVLLVQFPEHFSKVVTVAGVTKTVPDPVQAAYVTFLGPLIGSIARPFGGWLADRKGGAVITFWAFIAMTGAALTVFAASQANSLPLFIAGFVALFIISGLANGSCYKMIPVLFRGRATAAIDSGTDPKLAYAQARRRTGAVIGIAGAIGAFGGLGVNIAFRQSFLHNKNGNAAYLIFIGFYVLCALITWAVYLRTRRTADAATTVEAIAAARPAPAPSRPGLHGAVVSAAGPVSGAPITLLDDQGRQLARTRADNAGSFHLTGVAPGRYLLICSGVGMYHPVSTVVEFGPKGLTLDPFVLVEAPVDPMSPDSEVAGTVRDALGPVADALVTLLDGNGVLCTMTHTDRAGRFRVVGPTLGGPSTLTVVGAGFEPTSAALFLPPGVLRHDVVLNLYGADAGPSAPVVAKSEAVARS